MSIALTKRLGMQYLRRAETGQRKCYTLLYVRVKMKSRWIMLTQIGSDVLAVLLMVIAERLSTVPENWRASPGIRILILTETRD